MLEVEELDSILFFTALSQMEKRVILPKLQIESHKSNETIIYSHENNTDVFFVLDGCLEISRETTSGQYIFFENVNKGQFFGEFSAIDGEPRSAEVKALEKCKLIRMRREIFISLLLNHPKLAIRMMERLVAIIRNGNTKIVDMLTLTAVERLYNYLISIGEKKSQNNSVIIEKLPSQVALAASVGTTRETISRAINKMITDQIIMKVDSSLYVKLGYFQAI